MSKFSKLVVLALSMVMVLGLVGCDATPTAGEGSTSEATGAAKDDAPKPLDLAIGKPADYGDFTVTVTKAAPGPKDFAGAATFQIDVTYENKSEEAVSYNEFDWQIENADKARSQETAMVDGKDSLGSGELAPGGKVSGSIFFAPKGDVVKIVYEPSLFAGEENLATWNVK